MTKESFGVIAYRYYYTIAMGKGIRCSAPRILALFKQASSDVFLAPQSPSQSLNISLPSDSYSILSSSSARSFELEAGNLCVSLLYTRAASSLGKEGRNPNHHVTEIKEKKRRKG